MKSTGRYLVLRGSRWNFTDEDSGRKVLGAKIVTAPGDAVPEDDQQATGLQLLELGIDTPLYDGIEGRLPAICDVETTIQARGKNVKLVATRVQVVQPFNLAGLFAAAAKP